MGKTWRKQCDGTQCRDQTFFRAPSPANSGGDPFFNPPSAGDPELPDVQLQGKDDEKKDPLTEGLKTTAGQLGDNEAFKKWYEPRLDHLKLTLWDNLKPEEKAAMISFLGVNAAMFGAAFATNPQLRNTLSDVNIGKPLGWIPYSPVEGFKYKLPGAGKTATGFSADFTGKPYLDLWKNRPAYAPSGVTFGLDSSYDPKGGFNLTGGKFGLEFLNGGLTATGSVFNQSSISPYPMFVPGAPGMGPGTIMQEIPGVPDMKTGPGYKFMLNADLMKIPRFRRLLEGK